VCGVLGAAFGILLQWWTSRVAYPLEIGGKPPLPIPAWIPVAFETGVLFAALGCFFGLWLAIRLPRFDDPRVGHPTFHQATDDRFFISVTARGKRLAEARSLLEFAGAREIAEVTA
jgi:hypothetical protein